MIVRAQKIYISLFCYYFQTLEKDICNLKICNSSISELQATTIFCNIADQLTGTGDAGLMLHDIVLPTIVTMFTVVLSIAACILLLIIKRQWETLPGYHHHQHQQVRAAPHLSPDGRPGSHNANLQL